MKGYKVSINNKIYNTISEAAKAIGCFQQNLGLALKRGQTNYKGYTIKKLDNTSNSITHSKNKRSYGCPVTCTTTNEKFNSIQAVADKLNLNAWTIGLKMEKAGKFVDKNGNEYIREIPIQSRKSNVVYPEQKPFMLRESNEKISRTKHANTMSNITHTVKKVDVRQNTINTLQTVSSDLLKNGMYKEASYVCEVLAQLAK